MKKIKKRVCKVCKGSFIPERPMIMALCSYQCALDYNKKQEKKKLNKWRKEEKEKMLTHSDYIQLLQKAFNEFIRLRDKGKNCISCDCNLNGKKYDAGHFYPTTYQFLRFNEWNVNAQCVKCNRDLHGNALEYSKRLVDKIGIENLNWLDENRHKRLELTISEIKEKIIHYKNLIKKFR